MRIRILCLAVAAGLLAGCTDRRATIDVKVSHRQGGEIEFYAYTTPLPANEAFELLMLASEVDDLEGKITLEIPDSVAVYPIYKNEGRSVSVIHPASLKAAGAGIILDQAPELPGRPFELGYFLHEFLHNYRPHDSQAHSTDSRIKWLDIDEPQHDLIREALLAMRRDAAAYGAQAVTHINITLVESSGRGELTRLLLRGRAVVFHQGETQPEFRKQQAPEATIPTL